MLPALNEEEKKHRIAKRVALEFSDGDVVNLGIGIPALVSDYIPEGVRVILQTENGVVGAGPKPDVEDLRFIGAGGRCLSITPGGSCIASDLSFGIIRGGHLDATVLGALQVDSEGNLANWMVPGGLVAGMGGAMDLVVGAKKVIIATTHTTKDGRPKLVKKCTLPLTAVNVVDVVVTELALFRFRDGKMILEEMTPGVTVDDIRACTEADFAAAEPVQVMKGVAQ